MTDYYLGEIRLFAGIRLPTGWAFCQGQMMNISDNEALYALIGVTYGGDGRTTFALPDLRGRLPVGQGQGPQLTNRTVGQKGGAETVTLTDANNGPHAHALQTAGANATTPTPGASVTFANTTSPTMMYLKDGLGTAGGAAVSPIAGTISTTGGGQSHNNLMPSMALNYIIALNGIFPVRPS